MIIFEISILLFGAMFSFVWALQIFISRNKLNIMAWIMMIASIWLLSGAYFFSGYYLKFPYFYAIHFPLVFLCGPLFFHYYKKGIEEEEYSLFYLHLLPALIVLALILPFQFMNLNEKYEFFSKFKSGNFTFYHYIIFALNIGSKISILSYLTKIILENIPLLKSSRDITKKSKYIFILVVTLIYIDLAIGLIGFFIKSFFMVKLSALLLPINLLIFFLMSSRFPEIVFGLRKEIKLKKYERSKIDKLDLDSILSNMESVMSSEKAFADEDLTLTSLAGELNISAHQLSQILNEKLNKTFPQYINTFRVKEAQKMILEDEDRSLLSIAFAVGFNSKASFNRSFKSITGITPQDYRKRNNR